MATVCTKCQKSLTVRESVLDIHVCDDGKSKQATRSFRKTGSYVTRHFTELVAAELRKTLAE
jgi:hypothetical protein